MLRKERQIHADNIPNQQPPSQASTSSVRTQPHHTEGQYSQRNKGISYKTPIQHDDVGLITPLIPHPSIPAQEPRRQCTVLEGGKFCAPSYTWSLPPSCILAHFSTSQLTHWSRPQLSPKWRLTPLKTQHPLTQTDISQYYSWCKYHPVHKITFFFKTLPVLLGCTASSSRKHISSSTLADTWCCGTYWSNRWDTPSTKL